MSQPDIEIPPKWKDISNLAEYKPLPSTENIKKYIENISNIKGSEDLKQNLILYKNRLTNLIQIINPLLINARTLIPKLDFERYLKTILTNPFIKQYKTKLDETSWNKERIKNDDIDGQEQEYIYVESDTSVDEFKKQLLILFSPFLTDTKKLFDNPESEKLNENLIEENQNCEKLIELAEQFRSYVIGKKQKINELISINYIKEDIAFIDNVDIKEEDMIEKLTEDKLDDIDKLSIDNVNSLLSLINDNIKSLDVVKEIETFDKNIIFKKDVNTSDLLKNILDLDGVVIIKGLEKKRKLPKIPLSKENLEEVLPVLPNTSPFPIKLKSEKPEKPGKSGKSSKKNLQKKKQKGGFDFPKEYIISDETNVSLINLLKNLNKLQETFSTLIEDAEYLAQLQIRYNNYIHYIFSIIQRLMSKDNGDILEFYRYLDKSTINKYIEKLNSIKSQINKDDEKMKFLNKYHYITIDKVLACLNFINSHLESGKLVDINNCKGNIKNDLNVFNNFRKIIDSIQLN